MTDPIATPPTPETDASQKAGLSDGRLAAIVEAAYLLDIQR